MLNSKEVADLYHLEVRCKILEIAAIYDRYDRALEADQSSEVDERMTRSKKALEILSQSISNRAETVALLYTDE